MQDETKYSLNDLLKLHKQTSKVKHCLPKNIADGYLLKNNRIYRNLRALVLEEGYIFTTKEVVNSRTFPLSSLDDYHQRKAIPYFDNVAALIRLRKKRPKIQLPKWHRMFHVNYLLHESSHAYAHSLCVRLWKQNKKNENSRYMISLLEESYANTVEIFGYIFCENEENTYCMGLNNYTLSRGINRKLSSNLSKELLEVSFGMMLLSFMFANYIHTKIDARAFKEMIQLVREILNFDLRLSKEQKAKLREIADLGNNLSIAFRIVTAEFYTQLNGYKTPLNKLVQYDFMTAIRKSPEAKAVIQKMIRSTLAE